MKTKRLVGLFAAALLISGTINVSASDEANLPTGYWNIAEPYRYVIFASDGGSYIRPLEKAIGTTVNLYEYIPTKEGYIFDGWYSDPRTKEQQVTEVTLNENIVVFAKWIGDETPKVVSEAPVPASTKEILAYGNYVDETRYCFMGTAKCKAERTDADLQSKF